MLTYEYGFFEERAAKQSGVVESVNLL